MEVLLKISLLLVFCVIATGVEAADPQPLWLRDPAISPDGSRIAFRFRSQLWIASASGGAAQALTPSGFYSGSPVWSPDGKTLAFASNRFGPMNIFAVPSDGGEAKRLTWYSRNERPTGFSPDGKSVLFNSPRRGDAVGTFAVPAFYAGAGQLYQVPATGGRETMVLPNATPDARWNHAGTQMLYTSASPEQNYRKGQVSSAARQVWLYDAASGRHERLTHDVHESRDAVWAPDGSIYYLSETSGSLNIWHMSLPDRMAEQVTHFTGDPIRSLSISDMGDLAFSYAGDLYRLPHGTSEPQRLDISILQADYSGEHPGTSTRFDDFVVSPTGREVAVVTLGNIYVASLNGEYVRRLPHTSGEERDPDFSPDGRRIVYGAERDGHWNLYESSIADPQEANFYDASTIEEKLVRAGADDAMTPKYAPDGKHIAYVANRESIHVLDIASKADVEILPKGQNFFDDDWTWWLSWSPDSKWIAIPVQPSTWIQNVAVAPADGSHPAVRVAPAGEEQWDPQWSKDGGILYWRSNKDALRRASHEIWTADVQGILASAKAREALQAKLREPMTDEIPAGAPGGDQGNAEEKNNKNKPLELFAFDPAGVEDRKIGLAEQTSNPVYFGFMPDGVSTLTVAASLSPDREGITVTGIVRDPRRDRQRILFSGVKYQIDSPVHLSKDQKKLYFLMRDREARGLVEVDVTKGTSRLIRIAADTTRDEALARQAAFDQFWMLTKKKFYDPNLHGLDWDAIRAKYERFLGSTGGAYDLAELLSEMAGELNSSHTGAYVFNDLPKNARTASLGLYYDERYSGPGVKVSVILTGGPFDGDGALKPGDIIQAIDGEPIPEDGGIRRALLGRIDQTVAVTAQHPDGTQYTERRVPISLDREARLARERWAKSRRDYVTAQSCGHLGYVYLPGMEAASYRDAFSDVFGRFQNADGLIVDERFNGGGWLHNNLIALLSGKPYMSIDPPRGGPQQIQPQDRWTKPSLVVMNAFSYSDSSIFPQAYRDMKLGKLVGDPVAGTGTAVWWDESNLIPNLVYGLPELPLRKIDGHLSENEPIEPDILVPSDPTAWAKGKDPQLDAAIASLMTNVSAPCSPQGAAPSGQ